MLHVICLNPAIDKIYRIPDFAAGEDYPGQKPEVRVGGKGVNVAWCSVSWVRRFISTAFCAKAATSSAKR